MSKKSINFLGQRNIAIVFSSFLIIFTIYQWVHLGARKYGIDFVGGTEIVVRTTDSIGTEELTSIVQSSGLDSVSVQSFEFGSNEFSVKVAEQEGFDHKQIEEKVRSSLSTALATKYEILKTDSVGSVISSEVQRSALIAIALGILGLLVYIAFRFEFAFGLGAVIAVFHDVIVALGIYLSFGYEINGAVLAAALTILGYSVNDTIVLFDRVREELRKRKAGNLEEIMNDAINFCLSRTIVTSALTLLAAVSLLVLGGGAIQDLSLFLVVGIIIGTYSTIYIASPVVLFCEKWKSRKKLKA